jgi:ribosomal protein S18 acetylase RimI-like enzyme
MNIRPLQSVDEAAVLALWARCDLVRPWNDPRKDIHRKLQVQPDLFLVGVLEQAIVATVMAGYDGHRGWINYLAVAPEQQRQGHGRQIMAEAERCLRPLGCPKSNWQVRTSNRAVLAFSQRIGYALDEVVSLGKRLEQDQPASG